MKEMTVDKIIIEDSPPRLNETYLCLTSIGKLFICDYEHTYNFFGRKSKNPVFRNRFSKLRIKVDDVIAYMSVHKLHNLMVDKYNNEP